MLRDDLCTHVHLFYTFCVHAFSRFYLKIENIPKSSTLSAVAVNILVTVPSSLLIRLYHVLHKDYIEDNEWLTKYTQHALSEQSKKKTRREILTKFRSTMRCPGGVHIELSLLAVSLSVCAFCALPAGLFISNVNQIQNLLVHFTNSLLEEHYGANLSQPTLLLVWGVILASGSIGCCASAWIAYSLKSRLGCKKALFALGCGAMTVGAIAESASRYVGSVELFAAGLIVGTSGVLWSVAIFGPIYLSECSPSSSRAFTGMFTSIGFYAGVLLGFVLGLPNAMGTEHLWDVYCLLPVALTFAGIIVSAWLPESPKDLYTTLDDAPMARRNLKFLYGEEHHDIDAVIDGFNEENGQTNAVFKLSHLLTESHLRKALVVSLLVNVLAASCGPFVMLVFSNAAFLNLGLPRDLAGNLNIALVAPLLVLTPLSALVVEQLGRRTMVLRVGAVMVGALAVYVVFGTLCVVEAFVDADWLKFVAAMGVLVNFWLSPFGPPVVALFYPTELFPQHARTAGVVATCVAQNAFLTVEFVVFPALLDLCGPLTAIVVLVVPSVVAIGLLWKMMPETASRSVNEVVRGLINNESCSIESSSTGASREYGTAGGYGTITSTQ